MPGWMSSRVRKWLVLAVLVMTAVGSAGVLVYRYGENSSPVVRDRALLKDYRQRLQNNPLTANLLLRSARSHYGYVRYRLRNHRDDLSALKPFLERGLAHYRRLLATAPSYMNRRDYFYAAYLYHRMGRRYDQRAQTMALKAYDGGYRTPELITLLANLHFRSGEYEVALNFYRSLGENLRDPVLVYNKAMALRALGEHDRARTMLEDRLSRSDLSSAEPVGRRYRRALVRLELDRERYRRALRMIDALPGSEEDLKLRTLRARALMELGETERARGELEAVVEHQSPPRRARDLLERITSETDERRS